MNSNIQLINQHQESCAKKNITMMLSTYWNMKSNTISWTRVFLGFFPIMWHRSPSASWTTLAMLPASQGRWSFTCAKQQNSSPSSGGSPRQTGHIGNILEQVYRGDSGTGTSDIEKKVQRVGTCSGESSS